MITIILVVFKTDPIKLRNILNKIDKKFKIIIVDNSENYDFSNIRISKNTLIIRSKNIGNGRAINKAIKKCKTKFAIYMDIDIEISKNFISKFLKTAIKIKNFGVLVPNHGNYKKNNINKEFYFGEASVMFYNLEILKKIGYFDGNIFLYYEETDLLHRCKLNKIKCYIIQNLSMKHYRALSIKNENEKIKCIRAWHFMWSEFYFYKKNFGFFFSLNKTYSHLIKDFIMLIFFIFSFNLKKSKLRFFRLYGLISSILGTKSFLRP